MNTRNHLQRQGRSSLYSIILLALLVMVGAGSIVVSSTHALAEQLCCKEPPDPNPAPNPGPNPGPNPAGPVQALPGSCTKSVVNKSVSAKCTSGTGEFRVVAECISIFFGQAVEKIQPGPWRAVGGKSIATCLQLAPVDHWIEKR